MITLYQLGITLSDGEDRKRDSLEKAIAIGDRLVSADKIPPDSDYIRAFKQALDSIESPM